MIDSIKSLSNALWNLESETKILQHRYYAPAWHMVRMKAYYAIALKMGIFSNPHPYASTFFSRLYYFLGVVVNVLFIPVRVFKAKDVGIIVFEHPRSKVEKCGIIDEYSHLYIKEVLAAENVLIFSRTFTGFVEKSDGFCRISIDIFEIFRSVCGALFWRFAARSDEVTAAFDRTFNYPVSRLLARGRIEYRVSYLCYSFLFHVFPRLHQVVLVDGYSSRAGIIAAAKKNGVEVVELQHGVITKYHLGYSYPDTLTANPSYVPDKIITWDSFWSGILKDVSSAEVSHNDSNYYVRRLDRYVHIKKVKATVIFISQGAISDRLSRFLIKNASLFSDFKVFYKLHPSEYGIFEGDVEFSEFLRLHDNVEVLQDCDLYSYLAFCEYQIGVFSTALFEGLVLGCRTVILDFPGAEYWEGIDNTLLCSLSEVVGDA